jgi:ribonuclease J
LQVTVHRGAHEVGGNCVEVRHGSSRIVLDLGLPLFQADREPHDSSRLRALSLDGLRSEGIVPAADGLFLDDDANAPDAILLSHAHLDHTGLLERTKPTVPVYASRGASKMMLAGKVFARQVELPRERFRPMTAGKSVAIGAFTVTPYAVDHSIYGALGFLIEAGGESLFYSGDLRMHGADSEAMQSLVEALRVKRIGTLVMEGTHLGLPSRESRSERQVAAEIATHIEAAPGLVLASLSPQHVDRLAAFYEATRSAGRTFAVDLYTAFVMHLAASETRLPRPTAENGVRVFLPLYHRTAAKQKQLASLVALLAPEPIGLPEVLGNPTRFVTLFRESMFDSDYGGVFPQQTLLLYSRWSGYLDQPAWNGLRKELDASSGRLVEVHSSGHIHADDIRAFVERVAPERVVPIHTFEPEAFAAFRLRRDEVARNDTYATTAR